MTTRERVLVFFLWWSVIGQSTWLGGTLYQMLVVVPMWSHSPPESVPAFFQGTSYNETIWNFFGPPFMAARVLPVILSLALAWHLKRHRAALAVAVACLVFAVAFTILYVYPINDVLFAQADGSLGDDEVRALAAKWIAADRLRFAVGSIGFIALLIAFRLPLHGRPAGAETRRS